MTTQELGLFSLFTGWWLLSFFAQTRSALINKLRYRDLLHLIPSWRLFAPAPGCRDYHLEYRIRHRWQEAPDVWRRVRLCQPRSWSNMLYNPTKRTRKAAATLVRRLLQQSHDYGYDVAVRSLPYLSLLIFLQRRESSRHGVAIQFRIVSCQDFARDCQSRLLFTSSWHIQESPLSVFQSK